MNPDTKAEVGSLDRVKLRARLRKVQPEWIYHMLDRAIDGMHDAQLLALVRGHFKTDDLLQAHPALEFPDTVRAFAASSLKGEYFQSFDVNSKNCTQQSTGTTAWIEDCHRHLRDCVTAAKAAQLSQAREGFDLIFDLLRKIDAGHDIVFFADEPGAWQVHVDWRDVLPAWLKCVSATEGPEAYARLAREVIAEFVRPEHEHPSFIRQAMKIATPEQARCLTE